MAEKYDIAILGGGPGGYVAAIRAAQLGFKTVVIDKDKLGGICLNWGCIQTINADNIILATGARPRSVPSIPADKKNIITTTEAMNLPGQPKELIVIGAGAIGIEFAYFYSVLGTKVTVIEMLDSILPTEDKDVSDALAKSFKKRGIELFTKTSVEK